MAKKYNLVPIEDLRSRIHLVRGCRVILDSDLAQIFQVPTKQLNQQFRRNRSRFPKDFAFQLTTQELINLRSQIAISRSHGGRRYLPIAFTEHGAIMLATVLNSEVAIAASVRVVRAFIAMREQLASHKELANKLNALESRLDGHDESIRHLFEAIRQLIDPANEPSRRQIGFHVKDRGFLKGPTARTSL